MKQLTRDELIEKSIRVRAFSDRDSLIVNIATPTATRSFVCDKKDLDNTLKTTVLKATFIFSSFEIDGRTPHDNDYFVEVHEDSSNNFYGKLNSGEIIECDANKYLSDSIYPTANEIKNIIYKNLEEF